jgi:hypothetical protein
MQSRLKYWQESAESERTAGPEQARTANDRELPLKCRAAAIGAHGSQTFFGNIFWNFAPRFPEKNDESKHSMKCIAMLLVVSFACLSQTFAVLRPLFPIKPEPPFAKTDGKQ